MSKRYVDTPEPAQSFQVCLGPAVPPLVVTWAQCSDEVSLTLVLNPLFASVFHGLGFGTFAPMNGDPQHLLPFAIALLLQSRDLHA